MKRHSRPWLAPLLAGCGVAAMVIAAAGFLFIPSCRTDSGSGASSIQGKPVILSFFSPEQAKFLTRKGMTPKTDSAPRQIKALIDQMGEKKGNEPALPFALPVRAVFIRKNGVLLLDFEKTVKYNHTTVMEEMAILRSLLETITSNFKELKAVKIVIGGQEEESLAGHIDISRPLTSDDLTW